MKYLSFGAFAFLFFWGKMGTAQVFQSPFPLANQLALAGATIAQPKAENSLSGEAVLGNLEKSAVFAGAALPYSLSGWQSAEVQGIFKLKQNSGVGFDWARSAVEGYTEQRFRAQYGRRLTRQLTLGGSFDYLHVSAREYGAHSGTGLSAHLLAEVVPHFFLAARIGHAIQPNLGGQKVPSNLRLGAFWQVSSLLNIMVEVEKEVSHTAIPKIGFEYRPVNQVTVRLGVRGTPARVCGGIGLRLKNGLMLDAGSEWHAVLGATPAAAVGWRF